MSSDEEFTNNDEQEFQREEVDDEDEYYEDEEDEEQEDEGKSRKKKKKKDLLQQFFDVEAEDDEEEDDEDEEDAEEGYDVVRDELEKSDRTSSHSHRKLFHHMEKEDDMREIADYYKKRYSKNYESSRFGQSDELSDAIIQQKLLPGFKDPNLWTVKCRIGEEKQTALLLMRKFNSYLNKADKQPLQIKSVIVKEGLKGFIYVEAYKQTHVKTAIEDIGNLKLGVWKQEMVPFKEMPDVLKVLKEIVKLKVGSWVRLKRTIYKDDLAQVEEVDMAQNQVTLRLVPRIDYTVKRGHLRDQREDESKKLGAVKRKIRPAQKLFDAEAVQAVGGIPSRDKLDDCWIFENNRYTAKGFLIKTFPLSVIISEGVKPTLSELQRFEVSPDAVDPDTAALLSKTALDKSHNFVPGDVVEVCQGELVHLTGRIIGIDGDKIRMMPDHEELKDPIEFVASELKKYFKVGEHVKVIGGRNEGETGLIVRVEDNTAIIISDLTMEEITVFQRFLQLCQSAASGVDSMGQFEWGDLVQIDAQTVGVIVRLEKEMFRVLTMNNKVNMLLKFFIFSAKQT